MHAPNFDETVKPRDFGDGRERSNVSITIEMDLVKLLPDPNCHTLQ